VLPAAMPATFVKPDTATGEGDNVVVPSPRVPC
jgi:hypothetical protein